jgi:nucleotide-binding universal stress UspA family protein
MPFNRILAAVDFSPNSLDAFRVASDLARLRSAFLHLLHVIEPQPAVTGEAVMDLVQKANTAIEELVGSLQPPLDGTKFTSEVASGRAFDEILECARQWRADLIVLGTKGTRLLEEILLGGTAEQVIKDSPCSVLVVKDSKGSNP